MDFLEVFRAEEARGVFGEVGQEEDDGPHGQEAPGVHPGQVENRTKHGTES